MPKEYVNIFTEDDEAAEYVNYPVPVPEFLHVYKMDLNVSTREVFVAGEIDEDFGPWFTTVIKFLEQQNDRPIIIYLNTPGGDEVSMFAFHDIVQASSCHVTVVATGQICSAGVLMLACANRRLVTESCVLMSHRGKGTHDGDLETLQSRMKYVEWSEKQFARLMDRYTPEEVDGQRRDYSYWFQLGKKRAEWWVLGGEAIVAEGIADGIYNLKDRTD